VGIENVDPTKDGTLVIGRATAIEVTESDDLDDLWPGANKDQLKVCAHELSSAWRATREPKSTTPYGTRKSGVGQCIRASGSSSASAPPPKNNGRAGTCGGVVVTTPKSSYSSYSEVERGGARTRQVDSPRLKRSNSGVYSEPSCPSE
jgi:hypothetical protein